jgi:hypothetical protein
MLAAGLLSLPLVALAADATPKMGSTKDTVRSQFGSPVKQIPGVGTPSISRWEYQDFTVYFEDDRALHSVRHATALAQPPAATPVETLPPIEEISNEADAAPSDAAASEPATDTTTEQPAAEAESAFRFDPVSGRIIEVGADGKAIQSPTAQPVPAAPVEAEAPAPAPADEPEAQAEPETTKEDLDKEKAAAAAAAAAVANEAAAAAKAPKAPAAPTPAVPTAPAAPAAPAAEPGQPQFRFDPVSGRIVVDDPAAKAATVPEQPKEIAPAKAAEPAPEAKAAPSEAPKQAEAAPESKAEVKAEPEAKPKPKPKSKTEKKEESGGFSVDWGA